ncbi:MAG: hypothetical protein PHP86_13350 [Nevskiales bacterium]|nr:hypothetical protein [Nevskiales bacterium]
MDLDMPAIEQPPADLLGQRQAELDELFATLAPVSAAQADGYWRGTLMAILGFGWLPRPLARLWYRLLRTPLNPWRGKSFAQGGGANRWFGVRGPAFGRFKLRETHSPIDGQPVLWLDYDIPENPRFLRPIRGEARMLGNGLVLARMNWQTRRGLHRVLYFTLTPAG